MRQQIFSAVTMLSLCIPAAAWACPGDGTAQNDAKPASAATASIREVTVPEVASLQKEHKAVLIDANDDDFRAGHGVIPGATLLSSLEYDAARELPAAKDQQLVFYCANTYCGASHAAAERAVEAGYKNVAVMRAGLMGWKSAGQATASYKPRS